MLIGSVKKLTSALLGAQAANTKPALPEQASTVPQAASGRTTTPGVVFDLSDAAWQVAEAASPEGTDSTAGAAAMAPSNPPPFLPAGMTIAAEIAAVNAPAEALAPASAAASAATVAAEQPGMAASPAQADVKADPDEEARARALAILAQERGKLLSLAEQLAEARTEAKTEAPDILNAPAGDAATDGKGNGGGA